MYLILILSTLAIVGSMVAVVRLVRRHMRTAHPDAHVPRLRGGDIEPRAGRS